MPIELNCKSFVARESCISKSKSKFQNSGSTKRKSWLALLVWRQVPGVIPRLLLVRRHPLVANAARADADHAIVALGRFKDWLQRLKSRFVSVHIVLQVTKKRLLTTPCFFFFATLVLNDCQLFFWRSPAASIAAKRSFFLAAFLRRFSISMRA